jgi:hypothetical protein
MESKEDIEYLVDEIDRLKIELNKVNYQLEYEQYQRQWESKKACWKYHYLSFWENPIGYLIPWIFWGFVGYYLAKVMHVC